MGGQGSLNQSVNELMTRLFIVQPLALPGSAKNITSGFRGINQYKHPAHSYVVGVKERGGGLTYGASLKRSGNDNNVCVCCVGHNC